MKKLLLIILIAICGNANGQNTWIQKADYGGGTRELAVGFSIGNKGYLGTGRDTSYIVRNDFWEYDPVTDAWTQKADFGGPERICAIGFSIGGKGYIGTGADSLLQNYYADFWEYDPILNTWTQKTSFPGTARYCAVGFSIGTKGYIGTGEDGSGMPPQDFWEYDQLTDNWTQKSDFPPSGRLLAVGFSIGNKGYIGTGDDYNGDSQQDFWEYNPATNLWTQKADFPGTPRCASFGFSIGDKGYIGMGQDIESTDEQLDMYEYNSATDSWRYRAGPLFNTLSWSVAFSISGKGYVGTGGNVICYAFLWEYTPDTVNISCAAHYVISEDTVPLSWIIVNHATGVAPLTYTWNWGDGNISYGITTSHTYADTGVYNICLTVNDALGCIDMQCFSCYLYKSSATMVTVTVITPTTGLNEPILNYNSLNIFPNPATGSIQLTFNTKHNAPLHCEIINVMGEKVLTSPLTPLQRRGETTAQLDVSFLAKGIYVVRVGDGERSENKKLVIQ